MYAKNNYHNVHYTEYLESNYDAATKILQKYSADGAYVLDYGCGLGFFLKAIKLAGFNGVGVEFDIDASRIAAVNSNCQVFSLENFPHQKNKDKFDVIHLGDVLEHLSYPIDTLETLLTQLKSGGILFVEGPLEENTSLVYWISKIFGMLKKIFVKKFIGKGTPTHLFRVNNDQQLLFFRRFNPDLKLLDWEVYETGWPYSNGGIFKKMIAQFAILLSGKKVGNRIFGNRFIGIFRYK